jgi:CubicO group peptidase (beta-lactamase class C family)
MPRIPRLPFVPDPLGRIHVPSNLKAITRAGEEAAPEQAGLTHRQVERMWSAARALYQTGVHPALALCVRRHGHVVIDRAIGHARGNGPQDPPDAPKEPATPDTPFCVFSTSKGITALVVHLLGDRGLLDIADRVTDYIPEYGRHGKGATTIGHVLAHRAAVPSLPPRLLDLESLEDRDLMIEAICDAKPFVKPGTLLAYHAVSGGLILGEIVERVAGKSIRQVLAEEILEPLHFRWGNYGVAPQDVSRVGLSYVTGPKLVPPVSNLVKRALSKSIEDVVDLSNQPRFLTSVIPSASIVTSANELSRFFEIFRRGGELDGVRVMQPETLRRAQRAVPPGDRPDPRLPHPVQLRADAGRQADQPVRAGHRSGVRAPGADQHHGLDRSRAGRVRRTDQQRQGTDLPRRVPLPGGDADGGLGGAEAEAFRAAVLDAPARTPGPRRARSGRGGWTTGPGRVAWRR